MISVAVKAAPDLTPGSFERVAREMSDFATLARVTVTCTVNGLEMFALPGEAASAVLERWKSLNATAVNRDHRGDEPKGTSTGAAVASTGGPGGRVVVQSDGPKVPAGPPVDLGMFDRIAAMPVKRVTLTPLSPDSDWPAQQVIHFEDGSTFEIVVGGFWRFSEQTSRVTTYGPGLPEVGKEAQADTAVPRGHCNRCDRCGWPFGANCGCTPGNCSQRPMPPPRILCAGCGIRFDDVPPPEPTLEERLRLALQHAVAAANPLTGHKAGIDPKCGGCRLVIALLSCRHECAMKLPWDPGRPGERWWCAAQGLGLGPGCQRIVEREEMDALRAAKQPVDPAQSGAVS